ncbi:MAG: carbamate kinase [Candidatus Thermoplasmatota archaeon]|nr:carbamate kinase [Candidatus Thermoplasmatota archaeon]
MSHSNKIVIALGGNALLRNGDVADYETQYSRSREALESLVPILKDNRVVITHGNGPQVGNILIQNESSSSVPAMPLHSCGSMSQGLIAEFITMAYASVRKSLGLDKNMIQVFTRTLVRRDDNAFSNPTKPIGPSYSKDEALPLMNSKKWIMKEYQGKGWRRVVPSPEPVSILEKDGIMSVLNAGMIPLCVGGGGIPVIESGGDIIPVDAVIDKDLASSLLASEIGADILMILTDVDHVYVDFKKENQKQIGKITYAEMNDLYASGKFEDGSMGPKVKAALNFIRNGGKMAFITSLYKGNAALKEHFGTVIVP